MMNEFGPAIRAEGISPDGPPIPVTIRGNFKNLAFFFMIDRSRDGEGFLGGSSSVGKTAQAPIELNTKTN